MNFKLFQWHSGLAIILHAAMLFNVPREKFRASPSAFHVIGYEVLGVAGEGPSGPVYLGRRLSDGREAALKVLVCCGDARLVEELEALVRAAACVDHPNLLPVQGVAAAGEAALAVASDFAPGGSLAERLGREPPPGPVCLAWMAAVAGGLEAAHAAGMVHLGIHPRNVLFSAEGEPMLGDFGLARVMGRLSPSGPVAGPGPAEGEGAARGESASDVLGLASLVLLVLSCAAATPRGTDPPRDGGRTRPPLSAVLRSPRRQSPLGLRPSRRRLELDLPRPVSEALGAALSRDPRRRPSTGELAAALREAAGPVCPAMGAQRAGVAHIAATRIAATRIAATYMAAAAGDAAGHVAGVQGAVVGGSSKPEGSWPSSPKVLPARPVGTRPRGSVRRVVAAACALAIAGAAVWLVAARPRSASRAERGCGAAVASILPGHSALVSRVAGDACGAVVTWRKGVATVTTSSGSVRGRFLLGDARDVLVLGDWYCRGGDSPALYSPETGVVVFFGGWAAPGSPERGSTPVATGVRNGSPAVRRSRAACADRVSLAPTGSGTAQGASQRAPQRIERALVGRDTGGAADRPPWRKKRHEITQERSPAW
jgi:hypothetical protein